MLVGTFFNIIDRFHLIKIFFVKTSLLNKLNTIQIIALICFDYHLIV